MFALSQKQHVLDIDIDNLTLKYQEWSITFTEWIKARPELITMANEVKLKSSLDGFCCLENLIQGKDKLEWSRTVDASKLETLKALMADPNYKDNLNVIIRCCFKPSYLHVKSLMMNYD